MNDDTIGILIAMLLLLVIFMIPSIVAFKRGHPNRWVILLLNIFLGATGIVWFGCLIWAFMAVHISDDPLGSNGGRVRPQHRCQRYCAGTGRTDASGPARCPAAAFPYRYSPARRCRAA